MCSPAIFLFFRTNEDKKLFLYLMKCRRLASFTKNSSCFQLLLRTQIWEGGRILKRRWWRVLSATVQLQFCSPAWSSENIILLLTKDVVYLFLTGSFRTECETVHIHCTWKQIWNYWTDVRTLDICYCKV